MQIQNIRDFARNRLADIMGQHNQVQGYGACNRAQAQAMLETKSGQRYQMSVVSAYAAPNGTGLGEVLLWGPGEFRLTSGEGGPPMVRGDSSHAKLRGPMKDDTWAVMAKWIRDHEPGAVTYLAGAIPQKAPQIAAEAPPVSAPDGREPFLGADVIFYPRPGEGVAGVYTMAATVTRVWSPLVVDITVFPPASEILHFERLTRRSPTNDRNVWDFRDDERVLPPEPTELADLRAEIAELRKQISGGNAKVPKSEKANAGA